MSQNLFKIYDGRTNFWQWDTGQKLIVLDDTVDQVHFSNKNMTHAIPTDVYATSDGTRICDIPDIILTLPKNLIASAYVDNGTSEKTIKSVKFAVVSRPIPSDYVPSQTGEGSGVKQFDSMEEAQQWAQKNDSAGNLISVNINGKWTACIVGSDKKVSIISGNESDLTQDIQDLRDSINDMSGALNQHVNASNEAAKNVQEKISELQEELNKKQPSGNYVVAIEGKGLSTEDFTTENKEKLSAIEDGAQKNVQSDYLQNDPTQDDYIKNRTHWSEQKRTVIVPENTFSGTSPFKYEESPGITTDHLNQNVTVTWDGVEYDLTVTAKVLGMSRYVYCGNGNLCNKNLDDTGEPFCFYITTPSLMVYYPSDSTEHTFKILGDIAEEVHQLDEKYIPSTIARASEVVKTVNDTEPDENGNVAVPVIGKDMTGKTVYPTPDSEGVVATVGAEIFNDYAERTYTDNGSYKYANAGNLAVYAYSHAEGNATTAMGYASHAEGNGTMAEGPMSHAEGSGTTASSDGSHAEGSRTVASGSSSHSEGRDTVASGSMSHAEGLSTIASGEYSHAEGVYTEAIGMQSHAEGAYTYAQSQGSHAQGRFSIKEKYVEKIEELVDTIGYYWENYYVSDAYTFDSETGYFTLTDATSNGTYPPHSTTQYFAEGSGTAKEIYKFITITSASTSSNVKGTYERHWSELEREYAHVVGNGDGPDSPSNAHTIDWDGNAWFAGNVYVGGINQHDSEAKILSTQEYVNEKLVEQIGNVFYGTCTTYASTTPKTVKVSSNNGVDFSLKPGVLVCILFTKGNDAGTMTLNINSTGAKSVKLFDNLNLNFNSWKTYSYATFLYDGTYWNIVSVSPGKASDTNYGFTKLSTSTSSTSTSMAATPSAVKSAYDLANAALPIAGGTMTGALTLVDNPTDDLHAVTKKYVDECITALRPKSTTISLLAANWVGDANPYSQVVTINGVTANSKIDLQPTAVQIVELQDAEITLMLQNDDGVVTAWAIGNKPETDYTMQALITEVTPV